MILEGLHEKEIFTEQYPFRLEMNIINDFKYPLHWHNAIEMVYNEDGICKLSIAGDEYQLHKGDILLIPSGEIHEISSCTKDGKRYFIQFNISALDGFGGISDIKPFTERTIKISGSDECDHTYHRAVEHCVTELIREYERKEYAYALVLNARIFDILVLIARNLSIKEGSSSSVRTGKKMAGLQQINRVFEYIEKNYPSDISLKDAAKAAGFSEYHFSRLFKESSGQSYIAYLNSYRIKQAEKMLVNSEKPVLDISLECGFNSLTTFNRTFRKIKGCSPTFYRKAGL